ncbi:hypothetical protein ACWGOQ_0020890 [Aquimarina sp. M1]
MKQFLSILSLLLITSCSNNSYKDREVSTAIEDEIFTEKISSTALKDAYIILISEKLQDYLDKQMLIKQHPKFIDDKDSTALFTTKRAEEIQQITVIGQPQTIADSITKIITKVHFSNTETDTIIAYITTSVTLIDGVSFKTTKASFEKPKSSTKDD